MICVGYAVRFADGETVFVDNYTAAERVCFNWHARAILVLWAPVPMWC